MCIEILPLLRGEIWLFKGRKNRSGRRPWQVGCKEGAKRVQVDSKWIAKMNRPGFSRHREFYLRWSFAPAELTMAFSHLERRADSPK